MMTGGNFINFYAFQLRYGNKPDSQLVYNIIYNALNRHKKNISYVKEEAIYLRSTKVGRLGRKMFFKLLKNSKFPVANEYLSQQYNFKMSEEHWLIPFSNTTETKLQVLQWKIIHGTQLEHY